MESRSPAPAPTKYSGSASLQLPPGFDILLSLGIRLAALIGHSAVMEPKVDCDAAVVTEQASRIRAGNQLAIGCFIMFPLKIATSRQLIADMIADE